MTKKTTTTVTLIDDVGGEVADETVAFSLDGIGYEIELTTKRAGEMREELMAWATAGRVVHGPTASGTRIVRVPTDQDERDAIRKWGGLHGYDIPQRGKIRYHIVDAYRRRPNGR